MESRDAARDAKLRRGGVLRSAESSELKNAAMVKRDFGIKAPFGL